MATTANDVVILSAKRAQKLGPVNFLVTPSQVQICIIKKKKEVSNTFLGNKQQERGIMRNRENKTNLIDSGSAAKQWRGERSTHRSPFPGCMINPRRKREREELKGKASKEVCEPCDCVRHHCSHRIPIYRRGSGVELTPNPILYCGQLENRELHKKESKGVQGLKHSLISIFQN